MFRKGHFYKLLYVAVLLVLPHLCLAQDYIISVQEFGVEEGLLHRDVLSVFEDNNGFIWVGTSNGVQRYDGHEFKSWTKQSKTGKIYEITTIGQDNAGWLWLWNNELFEFVFLNPITEQVLTTNERFGDDFPIRRYSESSGWNHSSTHLLTDSKGRLCFVSSQPNQFIFYDGEAGFETIPFDGFSDTYFNLKFIPSNDHLWVQQHYDDYILHEFDRNGKLLKSFDLGQCNTLEYFSSLGENIGFYLSKESIKQYIEIDQAGKLIEHFSERKDDDFIFFYSKSGIFWYLGVNGWRFYSDLNQKPFLDLGSNNLSRTITEWSNSVFEDSHGNIWLSSKMGLLRIKLTPNLFHRYVCFNEDVIKPINNSARGIFVDEDSIFVNFELGGLVGIDKNKPKNWGLLYAEKDMRDYFGRPLIMTTNGDLYSGNLEHVRSFKPGNSGYDKINIHEKIGVNVHSIWSLLEEDSIVWIGMDADLAYLENTSDSIHLLDLYSDYSQGEKNKLRDIYHISNEGEAFLWLCTRDGLLMFDKSTRKIIKKYSFSNAGELELPATKFYYLYKDKEGIYWLGTDEGLIRWNRNTNEKQLFTTIDGLSNNVIYAIYEDDQQHLWLSSDFGIMQFDKENFQVTSYLEKDGISHYEFNRISSFQEKDGTIYFGGLNGITAFNPTAFYQQKTETPFRLLITDFEIFDGNEGRLINKVGHLRTTNTINYHPNDRFFRLKFALLTMEEGNRGTYAWKIEGPNPRGFQTWNYQKENSLQIGKLPYGTHTLRIKGQSSTGQWSSDELLITINVLRPFYLKNWFFLFVFIGLALSIWLYNKYRLYEFKKTQEILEDKIKNATIEIRADRQIIENQANELRQLDSLKSRFFANVTHELRTPLTLILGPINTILKRKQLEDNDASLLKIARKNSNNLLKLIASILDLSKMEAGKIDLNERPENLFALIRRLVSAFESHAQRLGIRFSFVYTAEKDLQVKLDKDKLAVIINNLLSNAIKFTDKGGKVSVELNDRKDAIHILISDTGRGIHPDDLPHVFNRFYQSKQADALSEGGTGIGLALSQEYAKLMDAKLSVTSVFKKGSTFSLILPRKEVFGQEVATVEQEERPLYLEDQEQLAFQMLSETNNKKDKPSILIVEDNDSLRSYLQQMLLPYFEVLTANNGHHAWEDILPNNHFDLIISDVMMPIMDGYKLLKKLKSDDRYYHLPVIMLTARADMKDKIKALRIGVDDYILKPFDEEELLARMANLLGNYKSRTLNDSEKNSHETRQPFSEEDRSWLEECEQLLETKISDAKYSVLQLAIELAMSESTLTRQLKRLTGLTPARYFQEMRLNKARNLLESHAFNTVAQVAFRVGFSDPGAFSRSFKKRFGKLPAEVLN